MFKKSVFTFHEIKKIVMYAGNGIINTIVCYGLLLILAYLIDYRLAIVLVYIPGILLSYFLNRKTVFNNNKGNFPIFVIVSVLMMWTNIAVTWILIEVFQLSKILSMSIAIGAVFFLGYWLNKRYSFSKNAVKTRPE